MTRRPEVLLVSPVVPAAGGEGRAMRAYAWLTRLARDYRVHVLVLDKRPARGGAPARPDLDPAYPAASLRVLDASAGVRRARLPLTPRALLERVSPWVTCTPQLQAHIAAFLADKPIERVVVFRLYLHDPAWYAAQRAGAPPPDLDLDDIDSLTRLSVARALLGHRRVKKALVELALAAHAAWTETTLLRRYARLYLAAPEDAYWLRQRLPHPPIEVFPNQVTGTPAPVALAPPPFRLFFVGNLGYFPNEEAALCLVDGVVPRLRHGMPCPWALTIVGRDVPPSLAARCRGIPEVTLVADAEDLAPLYQAAHAVLVPLTSGGGTKFKTLEAMLHGRPVISTRHGVRGLSATPGEHYWPAERPEEFAAACAALAADGERALALARAGQALVLRHYHCDP